MLLESVPVESVLLESVLLESVLLESVLVESVEEELSVPSVVETTEESVVAELVVEARAT